jgi:hypothetical protein
MNLQHWRTSALVGYCGLTSDRAMSEKCPEKTATTGIAWFLRSIARRDLKLQQCHSLQRHRISFTVLGSAENGLCDGSQMGRTDRVRQRRNGRFHGVLHDSDRLWRKAYVRKVLHLVGSDPGAIYELNRRDEFFSSCECASSHMSNCIGTMLFPHNGANIRQIDHEPLARWGFGLRGQTDLTGS